MFLENLENILLTLLVIDSLALGVLILIQQGKGADVGAAFGGGSSNTMFGSAGSTSFLARLTSWLAVGFFFIAFGLAYTAKERAGALSELGMPQIAAPASGLSELSEEVEPVADLPDLAPELDTDIPQMDMQELTGESEAVDSDIPDV